VCSGGERARPSRRARPREAIAAQAALPHPARIALPLARRAAWPAALSGVRRWPGALAMVRRSCVAWARRPWVSVGCLTRGGRLEMDSRDEAQQPPPDRSSMSRARLRNLRAPGGTQLECRPRRLGIRAAGLSHSVTITRCGNAATVFYNIARCSVTQVFYNAKPFL